MKLRRMMRNKLGEGHPSPSVTHSGEDLSGCPPAFPCSGSLVLVTLSDYHLVSHVNLLADSKCA